jgi:protoporphyrinogen oxidase
MPLPDLVAAMDPPAPAEVQSAARGLRHRDFLTVALVLPQEAGFPDNWIYVHTPGVRVGRVQNYGSWSPYLVKDGLTCLGLEYFVNEGDDMWTMTDEDLVALAKRELTATGLAKGEQATAGYVVRVPKAYPVYDEGYEQRVDTIRRWVESAAAGTWMVGRNGMHKYNNQDHSMVTAMYAVDNILGGSRDLWAVNVEKEYHEEDKEGGAGGASGTGGTGREAPFHPPRAEAIDLTSTGTTESSKVLRRQEGAA